jgi:cytochrome bd-type quinol oxidase subunit 2
MKSGKGIAALQNSSIDLEFLQEAAEVTEKFFSVLSGFLLFKFMIIQISIFFTMKNMKSTKKSVIRTFNGVWFALLTVYFMCFMLFVVKNGVWNHPVAG